MELNKPIKRQFYEPHQKLDLCIGFINKRKEGQFEGVVKNKIKKKLYYI